MEKVSQESSVVGVKAFPGISILLPTRSHESNTSSLRESLSQVTKKVEQKLLSAYSKAKTDGLMNKLHHAINGIDQTALDSGIAIYISDEIEKVFHLPFPVTEKIIIDDSFEVRDLLYSAKMNRNYLMVLISRNEVKTLFGYGKSLVQVDMEGMPTNLKDVTVQHSLPGWDYLDKKAYDESNLSKFVHFIDKVIELETRGMNIPIIVFGDSRILGLFRKSSKLTKDILDYIDGNYEHATKRDLLEKIEPALNKLVEQEEKNALDELGVAIGKNQASTGIAQVWRVAAEARGRILLVEKDYRESARLDLDGYTLIIDDELDNVRNKIEDAVDDIVEMVLKNKGEVVFVSNGALEKFQRIAIVNRY